MIEIKLTKNQTALIDDEDHELISKYTWHTVQKRKSGGYYAETSVREGKKKYNIRMHKLITNTDKFQQVDHINGNGLDNRRSNLRLCNNSENHQNISKLRGNYSSKYKGVSLRNSKWRATICVNGKHKELGMFSTEKEAAKAYNEAAIKYFEKFARINIIE